MPMRMSERGRKRKFRSTTILTEENAGRHLAFGQSYAASLETHVPNHRLPPQQGPIRDRVAYRLHVWQCFDEC